MDHEAQRRRCPRCGSSQTVKAGHKDGRQRWQCRGCGRTFGATTGTPLWGLQTEVDVIARAILMVARRGSLRAAEEVTGHKYETISKWLHRATTHAEALSEAMARDLALSEVEIDEFWSFVEKKRAMSPTTPSS